jgi:hypothetical protein
VDHDCGIRDRSQDPEEQRGVVGRVRGARREAAGVVLEPPSRAPVDLANVPADAVGLRPRTEGRDSERRRGAVEPVVCRFQRPAMVQ